MSATTSVKSQEQKRPGIRRIMTWTSKTKDKELLQTHGYDSAPGMPKGQQLFILYL